MSELLKYRFGYPKNWTKVQRVRARKKFFDSEGQAVIPGLVVAFRNPGRSTPGPWKTSNDANQSLEDIYLTLHADNGAMHAAESQTRQEWDEYVRSRKTKRKRKNPVRKRAKKAVSKSSRKISHKNVRRNAGRRAAGKAGKTGNNKNVSRQAGNAGRRGQRKTAKPSMAKSRQPKHRSKR